MKRAALFLLAAICTACAHDFESASRGPTFIFDRVWVRNDAAGVPGVMRIFLRDGTLVSDSCWETYRLSSWAIGPGGMLVWHEDGAEIRAEIVETTDTSLVLRLDLVDGPQLERYEAAEVPWLCPDMPR